jgi:ATP-dependent Lon protease
MQDPGSLADLIASNIGLKVEEAQKLLEIIDPIERLKKVSEFLNKEIELLSMQARIQSAAKEEMGKTQRDYFLREQSGNSAGTGEVMPGRGDTDLRKP